MLLFGHHLLSSALLLYLHLGESLGLKADLVLHLVLLLNSEVVLSLPLLILLLNHLGLLGFLFLLEEQSILDFLLLVMSLLGHHIIVLRLLSFLLIIELDVEDFL